MVVPRPVAGRYAFSKRIRGTQRTIIWLASEPGGTRQVVASVVPGPRAAALEPIVEVRHEHAATLLGVFDAAPDEIPDGESVSEDARIAVAELVSGRSLQQRLETGPVSEATAVGWAIALADALATMHQRGGVHGALSPRAVLTVRPRGAAVPVLTHLLTPTSGAFCSPERVTGGGPSEADDTWALAATLYTALGRKPPFAGSSRTELARAIVAANPPPIDRVDPDLLALVLRGLARDPHDRYESAEAFRDALRAWVEATGARSLGDFATVEAMVGMSEPPPNVGDLSLVAALVRPDSPEALAPLPAETKSSPYGHDLGDEFEGGSSPLASDEPGKGAEVPASAGKRKSPGPPPLPASTGAPASPVSASRPRTTTARSPARKGMALIALAAVSAAIGVAATRLRDRDESAGAPAATEVGGPATPPTAESTPAAPAATPTATDRAAEPGGAPAVPAVSASAAPPGAEPAAAAAAATAPGDVNACVASAVPEGTFGSEPDVGFLCAEKEMWGLARRTDLYVAKHGQGPGMVLWAHLGRFDVAAVAVLRARCCPGAAPVKTATPKGVCETLSQSVLDLASGATPDHVDKYAADVDCLVSRGVTYPKEWWDRVGAKDARGYFEQLLGQLSKAK